MHVVDMSVLSNVLCTVPKVIDFPRYNMKSSGQNVILRGIVHVVLHFPLHYMLYRGNLDCFSNSVLLMCAVAVAVAPSLMAMFAI